MVGTFEGDFWRIVWYNFGRKGDFEMTEIQYQVGDKAGAIYWAASEYFGELMGREFALGKMEATEIEKMEDLSLVGRILLSAVAGAVIQHLLDAGVEAKEIFEVGKFWVVA